jgi:hypothetical protein
VLTSLQKSDYQQLLLCVKRVELLGE